MTDPMERRIAEYMDMVDLRIAVARAEMTATVVEKMRYSPLGAQARSVLYKDAAMAALHVTAIERWFISNPFEVRHLPHVLVQRGKLVDRPIEPLALTPGRTTPW